MKNFRDFSCGNIKKGLLFRSEALARVTSEDIALLTSKNMKLVVDLRLPDEREKDQDQDIPGATNISLPLLGQDDASAKPKTVFVNSLELPDLGEYYRGMVSPNRKEIWTKIFDLLLEAEGGVLFHCSGGKDRTGVTAAIILSALGASKEEIYQDYLETNKNPITSPGFEQFLATLDEDTRAKLLSYSSAKKEYLDLSFTEIDKLYGSLDGFFFECCSLDAKKRGKLLEKYKG